MTVFESPVGRFLITWSSSGFLLALVSSGNRIELPSGFNSRDDAKIAIMRQQTGFPAWDSLHAGEASKALSDAALWSELPLTVTDNR